MDLPYAWRLVVHQYKVIVLLALVGLVAAFAYTSLTKSYSTTTYLTVLPTKDQAGLRAVDPLRFFQTQTQVIVGDELLGAATAELGKGTTVQQLRSAVEFTDGASADVVGVTVTGPNARTAQAREQAVLGAIDAHSFPDVTMTRLWATPMVSPSAMRPLVGGPAVGLALGMVLVLLWGATRRPVYDPGDLQLGHDVRTYPLVVDPEQPEQVRQLLGWLGDPPSHVWAVGPSEAQASRLAAHAAVDETAGGPGLLVVTAGKATERALEEQAALASAQRPSVVVVVASNRRQGGQG